MTQNLPEPAEPATSSPDDGELDLSVTTGTWRISSTSETLYYVDFEHRTLLRVRPPGHGTFPFDNQWSDLVSVESWHPETIEVQPGVIRIGERPCYTFDPGPTWPTIEWRLQRVVTGLTRLTPAETDLLHTEFPPVAPR